VETLDRRLPFTFLDHKLRCGDSLVGTWLDQFRDYPLMAFDRESPDKKGKWTHGVSHAVNTWHDVLKAKRADAIGEQADVLSGQLRIDGAAATDEELKAAVERVRRLYRELRAVPAGRPDERARIWRERIHTDAAMEKVREAFDTWCAIWFWPLDRLDLLPTPATFFSLSAEARDIVKEVRDRYRFLHWELEFADVFTGPDAGFDAVVGNPPWEILKPNSKEFFSNHDPLFRAYGKQQALAVQKALFEDNPAIETTWLGYLGDFKDRGNFVRSAAAPSGDTTDADGKPAVLLGSRKDAAVKLHEQWSRARGRYRGMSDPAHPFRHQGSADLNTYKMFAEVGHAVLRNGGQLGLVVPSGLYTDKGTGDLRRLLLQGCRWRWLYGFENRDRIFDIHRSFKFCVTVAEKGGETAAIRAAFMRHDLEDWAEAVATLDYPFEDVDYFSPFSKSILELRDLDHQALTRRQFERAVLVGRLGDNGIATDHGAGLHMTSKSKLFPPRAEWERRGFSPTPTGLWQDPSGSIAMPLLQGAMIWQFDSWYSDSASLLSDSASQPLLMGMTPSPNYLISPDVAASENPKESTCRLGFRDVQNATNQRTFVGTILPPFPAGNTINYLTGGDLETDLFLLASLSFFATDYLLRNKMSQNHVNWFYVEELPVPVSVTEAESKAIVARLAERLCMIGPTGWLGCRLLGRQPAAARRWAVTQHERLRIRTAIDAVMASLYGLSRGDFAWILRDCDHPQHCLADKAFCRGLDTKGFWRVDKEQLPELRHTVLSLAAFDDLQRAITAAGSRDAGIEAWCSQNDGDGWLLPEMLCVADLGLTRTVALDYDERAKTPQPVRSRMGERFLDWQLAQTPEESWAECERHAKALGATAATASPPVAADIPKAKSAKPRATKPTTQASLPGFEN